MSTTQATSANFKVGFIKVLTSQFEEDSGCAQLGLGMNPQRVKIESVHVLG